MNKPPKFVAEIHRVHEVALHGTANLEFWANHLQSHELHPIRENNRAQLVITAVAAKWMGITFRELSFGVLARADWNSGHEDGIYLAHALNSSRLFAFCERTFFHTPYFHSDLRLDDSLSVSIEAKSKGQQLFHAEMRMNREPIRSVAESWEGPIYLPGDPRRAAGRRNFFWAKLAGQTETYSFAAEDIALRRSAKDHPVLEWLAESGFAVERWSVRRSATHARSKTLSFDGK